MSTEVGIMFNQNGVYKITNKTNGKFYYGSTSENFRKRWDYHKYWLRIGKHSNRHLQAAWNTYKEENFDFGIVLICDKENCLYYEQLFLDKYWDGGINCYNICRIAENRLGVKASDETKIKMSNSSKGKPKSDSHRKNISKSKIGNTNGSGGRGRISPFKGMEQSAEAKRKISEALMGKKKTEATRKKMSEAQKNKNIIRGI